MQPQIINSLLDTDLYKITMQNAVAKLYSRAEVRYQFINRGKTAFPVGFAEELRNQIEMMSQIRLSVHEQRFLTEKCGRFLDPVFIDMIFKGYQYDPREVEVKQEGGDLSVNIEGNWARTIYWEVPLMALISELYFCMEKSPACTGIVITDINEIKEEAASKGERLREAKAKLMEFGTRRRHSFSTQAAVLRGLKESMGEYLVGTSNVYLAMLYKLTPHGTQAHEWISGIAAIEGLEKANQKAMERWSDVYRGDLGIALTDTFGTDCFFRDFDLFYANLFSGVRHDSGNGFEFMEKVIAHYRKLGIDGRHKTIVFSDSLDIDLCINLQEASLNRIQVVFGVGTHLSNSIGYKPLNMVIKLVSANGKPVIKLSDDDGKETGDAGMIHIAKQLLRY